MRGTWRPGRCGNNRYSIPEFSKKRKEGKQGTRRQCLNVPHQPRKHHRVVLIPRHQHELVAQSEVQSPSGSQLSVLSVSSGSESEIIRGEKNLTISVSLTAEGLDSLLYIVHQSSLF